MNLLKKKIDATQNYYLPGSSKLTASNYRHYQFQQLKNIAKNLVDYISKQNNNYLTFDSVQTYELIDYFGMYNSCLSRLIINVINNKTNERKVLLDILYPTLIDGYLFYINGNYYTPSMYIDDYPISVKKNFIIMQSYFKNNIIIKKQTQDVKIGGSLNIKMYHLGLLLFRETDDFELFGEFCEHLKINPTDIGDGNLFMYFKKKLSKSTSLKDVYTRLEDLFLDKNTAELYEDCYGFKPTLYNAFKKMMDTVIHYTEPTAIDLKEKRLTFLENIFEPVFTRVIKLSKQATTGYVNDEIRIDNMSIIKHFLKAPQPTKQNSMLTGLSGNYIYNITNLYSGVLKMKTTTVKPGINNPSKDIQNIDDSHFGRICPITVSSDKVGATVSVIPDTPVTKYGCFVE